MKKEIILIQKEAGGVKIRNSKGMLYQFETMEYSKIAITTLTTETILDYFKTLCRQHKQFVISINIDSHINPDE